MTSALRKKSKLPPFVALPWELLNSKAYKILRPSAAKALPFFLGKPKCTYNSPESYVVEFSFSYTEASRLGFANGTHFRNITDLIENGFIDPVCKGGKKSFGFSSSLFKLSRRWKEYDSPDFKKVIWRDIFPEYKKQKPTPKMETYSIKNGGANG